MINTTSELESKKNNIFQDFRFYEQLKFQAQVEHKQVYKLRFAKASLQDLLFTYL